MNIKQLLKSLFPKKIKPDLKAIVREGAQIIDVRTVEEFKRGHIKGAMNIPLQSLQQHLPAIKKDKAVITCCASGMRSASAKSILNSKGFTNVYNGGGWMKLEKALKG